jgi:hypothetical protein
MHPFNFDVDIGTGRVADYQSLGVGGDHWNGMKADRRRQDQKQIDKIYRNQTPPTVARLGGRCSAANTGPKRFKDQQPLGFEFPRGFGSDISGAHRPG